MSFKKIISLICIISIVFTNFYSYFAYPIGRNFSVMFMGNTEICRFSIINKMKEMDNRSNGICGTANPIEAANASHSILNYNNEDYQINSWHIYEGCQFMDQLTEHLREINAIVFCIDGFNDNPLEDINDFYFNLINNYSPNVNKIFVIGKNSPFQDEHLREELERRNCTNYSIMRTNPENSRDIYKLKCKIVGLEIPDSVSEGTIKIICTLGCISVVYLTTYCIANKVREKWQIKL